MIPDTAIHWPHASLKEAWDKGIYKQGATEPWTQQVVADLLIAKNARTVLELGTFLGLTTTWLALALEWLGGGTLIGVEIEKDRAAATEEQLSRLTIPRVHWTIHCDDSIRVLQNDIKTRSIDFAWVDDNHDANHVALELDILCRPTLAEARKMNYGGLVCMHDVSGELGLDGVCINQHGYVLDFPKLGPAGGLGLIQVL